MNERAQDQHQSEHQVRPRNSNLRFGSLHVAALPAHTATQPYAGYIGAFRAERRLQVAGENHSQRCNIDSAEVISGLLATMGPISGYVLGQRSDTLDRCRMRSH